MKAIKLKFIALAILVFGTFIFTGCSDEGSIESPDNSMLNYRITNENAFIDEFYSTSWRTGVSASVRDSLNTYVVTEIIVGSDTRARGYLVKDGAAKGDLLYLADVDRTGYVIKTVNLITEEWETITDIDKHPDYSISDKFDFIKIVDDGDYENQANGRPMFGSVIEPGACGPNTDGSPGCFRGFYVKKYFFWILASNEALTDDNGKVTEACECP